MKIGDKVIVRSNENEPLFIGIIVGDARDEGMKSDKFIPIVKGENGETLICMGIVVPYSDELLAQLNHSSHWIDQWNFLVMYNRCGPTYKTQKVKNLEKEVKKLRLQAEEIPHWEQIAEDRTLQIEKLHTRLEKIQDLADRLREQAQIHAMEARTQRATVNECLQATGTGKADWNGSRPVKETIEKLRQEVEDLKGKLASAESMQHSYFEELKWISNVVDPDEDGRYMKHQGSLLQRVEDTMARLRAERDFLSQRLGRAEETLKSIAVKMDKALGKQQ